MESTPDNDIRRDVFALMARKGWPMVALRNTDLTLEDLFLQLTSSDTTVLPQQDDAAQLDPDQDLDFEVDQEPEQNEKGDEE